MNESTGGGHFKTRILPKIKVNFCEPGRGNLCCKWACVTDAAVVSISAIYMTGLCCLLMPLGYFAQNETFTFLEKSPSPHPKKIAEYTEYG